MISKLAVLQFASANQPERRRTLLEGDLLVNQTNRGFGIFRALGRVQA